MEKVIATWIRYIPLFNQFFIKADKKEYQGCMEYVDDKFILQYFSEKYVIEFRDNNVANDWIKSIIERYYFSEKEVSLNYEKLKNDLPFISLRILSVEPDEYLIRVKSTKKIFNYDINNYYIAHMENDLRRIKLFQPIGEGKKLKAKKKQVLNKYEILCKDIINF
ncbi:hypothetical protein LL037_12565 [Clostridium estertheticum]|uniref:hypothetical protein n=1 Tax=Clostridium estertheticum TaxID=238834 RepID=UPI001C0AE976|nr:hypothetical protein [Clostridium estertheticum]MBU3202198.1 hypothetical protein [Clostridium estertheticum]WAG67914.1 hypothetical protein LL037_12565 [Clostridium estertheticum]